MNHSTTFTAELDHIEDLYEVSDEAVEAAAGNEASPSSIGGDRPRQAFPSAGRRRGSADSESRSKREVWPRVGHTEDNAELECGPPAQ
jgi:hypothetical protein